MDQDSGVRRREAVAGLSLLVALMLALVATFVYRIATPRPRQQRPAGVIIASDPLAPIDQAASAIKHAAVTIDNRLAPAAATPAPVEAKELQNAAPFVSGAEDSAPPFNPTEPPATNEPEARPRFVAPGDGANQ